nr:hypothetical protein CFP56_64013 [Quercus suber]
MQRGLKVQWLTTLTNLSVEPRLGGSICTYPFRSKPTARKALQLASSKHRNCSRLHDRESTRVADATFAHRPHLAAPLVPHETKPPLVFRAARAHHLFDGRHHDPDRMSATHGVPVALQTGQPRVVAAALARRHALEVHGANALVDRRVLRRARGRGQVGGAGDVGDGAGRRWLVVCVAEAQAPVREVGGDDERGAGIREVRRQHLAEPSLRGRGGVADQDRGERREGGGCMVGASRDCVLPRPRIVTSSRIGRFRGVWRWCPDRRAGRPSEWHSVYTAKERLSSGSGDEKVRGARCVSCSVLGTGRAKFYGGSIISLTLSIRPRLCRHKLLQGLSMNSRHACTYLSTGTKPD